MNYIKIPNTGVGQFFQDIFNKKQALERPCIISEDFRTSRIFYYKYRNLYTPDKTKAQPGDIVCWQYNRPCYVGLDKYKSDKNSYGTPIAVVVVPASHTENGKVKCMSLVNMSITTPEEGGDYSKCAFGSGDTGVSYSSIVTNVNGTTTVSYFDRGQIASDVLYATVSNFMSATDENVSYNSSGGTNLIPSPYSIAGGKNSLYFDTQSCTSDMDGKGNTQRMLDLATQSGIDWSDTIPTNVRTENCFQAAFCCNRYHTIGTNAGDWYFPSIGELGYLRARHLRIQEALNEIPNAARFSDIYTTMQSSTQKSEAVCWALNYYQAAGMSGGYNNPCDKTQARDYIRAFIEL